MKRRQAITGMLFLLGGRAVADRMEAEAEYQRFIVNLPPCDRVVVIRIGKPADEPVEKKGRPKSKDLPQGPDPTGKLYHVQPYDEWWKIAAQKTVTGPDAERLANLYRGLKQRPFEIRSLPDLIPEDQPPGVREAHMSKVMMGANCHFPPFAYRFFAGKILLYDTSICWGCENVIIGVDGRRSYFRLRVLEQESIDLFDVSNKLFPDHPAHPPWEK
ncbi:MAG TPA: hypothetical protein VGO11_19400 [Chthoniobacteraceae bacterium]|jgi:hypothetical protein|nr:hypothetical protein [Chthoniobacteraceae bacterium]